MHTNAERWRLIIDPPRDGAANMAIDEAILKAVGQGSQPPTLRLYRWMPACLSLGYGQPAADVDLAGIAARGWHLVRRMTGGRAILHVDELTYSVALPAEHPLAAGTIVESYRRLSTALMRALASLNPGADIHAEQQSERAKMQGPICFEVPSDYEITAHGKKLVGSAQVRKYGGIMQHGSLPLHGDVSRICEALVFASEDERKTARARVLERATTFAEATGCLVTWERAAEAVAGAFAATFDLALDETTLSEDERHQAAVLRESRYAADSWNLR